jgi:hypothetical protein
MDGVAALVSVLTASSTITTLVPAARVMAGVLPQGTALPAISIASVSKRDRHPLVKQSRTFIRERVQVTVLAATYESQKAVLRAVAKAADATFPAISGIENVTIHTDSAGPDFMNEDASIFVGSQDFAVTYSEAR